MARAATPGTDPQFVTMLRDLVVERAAAERGEQPDRPCVGNLGPGWDDCRPDCCPPLRRPGRHLTSAYRHTGMKESA